MTRREAILSIPGIVLARRFAYGTPLPNRPKLEGTLRLGARSRIEEPPGSGKLWVQKATLDWKVSESAIIICDMWDDHWCKSAARRVGENGGADEPSGQSGADARSDDHSRAECDD